MRLIDEAIASEPVKNTFRLGWEFIVLNKPLTLTVITLLFVLSILGTIPIIGVIFSIFSSALSLAIQIYVGRVTYESESIEHFVDEIKIQKGEDIVKRYFSPALGAYAGWMVIGLLLMTLLGFLFTAMGITDLSLYGGESSEELLMLLSTVALPLLVFLLIFFYVQPLIHSNIVMANDFKEGFFAVMTLFSVAVWQDAFKADYFKYIFWFSLPMIVIIMAFGILFSLLGSVPFLNIFLLIVFLYILMIMMSVSAMMARRILADV